MAVKDANYIRTWRNSSSGTYTIDIGDSVLIQSIYVSGATSDDFLQMLIDKTTVGYFRIGGAKGNHLAYPSENYDTEINILEFLRQKGIFTGYPVGEGQQVTWQTVNGSNVDVTFKMILADAGDYTAEGENGSQANEYFYLNYGRPSSDPSSSGDVLINNSLIPVEFPQFPFGAEVPAKAEIDVLGICGTVAGRTSGTEANKSNTTFIKFIKEREVLFDKLRYGMPLIGVSPSSDGYDYTTGYSVIGYNGSVDKKHAYLFDEKLTFTAGDELNIYVTTEVSAGSINLTAEDLEIALILKYRKVT
jgi:hypothetical protein